MNHKELDALKIRVAIDVFGWKETDKRLPNHDPNWLEYEAPWFELPDGSIFHHTHIPVDRGGHRHLFQFIVYRVSNGIIEEI